METFYENHFEINSHKALRQTAGLASEPDLLSIGKIIPFPSLPYCDSDLDPDPEPTLAVTLPELFSLFSNTWLHDQQRVSVFPSRGALSSWMLGWIHLVLVVELRSRWMSIIWAAFWQILPIWSIRGWISIQFVKGFKAWLERWICQRLARSWRRSMDGSPISFEPCRKIFLF